MEKQQAFKVTRAPLWIAGYTEGNDLPSEHAMELAEDTAFQQLQDLEREMEERRCPSLRREA